MSLTDKNVSQYPKFHSMEHLRRIAEAMKFLGILGQISKA